MLAQRDSKAGQIGKEADSYAEKANKEQVDLLTKRVEKYREDAARIKKAAEPALDDPSTNPPATKGPSGLHVFFPEMNWGEASRSDMTPVSAQTDDRLFSRPSDDLVLPDGTPLKTIHYLYAKDGLSYIEIIVSRTTDQGPVAAFLVNKFGKPKTIKVEGKDIVTWPAGDTMVSYRVMEDREAGIELYRVTAEGDFGTKPQSESKAQVPTPEVQKQKREPSDVGDVYTAELTCEVAGQQLPVVACFLKSSFKVRKGNQSKLYSGPDLMQKVGDSTSVRIDLPASFEIRAQNSAEDMQLRLQITQNSTKNIVFEDAAAQWHWILIKH